MIQASTKKKTPINARFLGVPYILLDSELNIRYIKTINNHLLNESHF